MQQPEHDLRPFPGQHREPAPLHQPRAGGRASRRHHLCAGHRSGRAHRQEAARRVEGRSRAAEAAGAGEDTAAAAAGSGQAAAALRAAAGHHDSSRRAGDNAISNVQSTPSVAPPPQPIVPARPRGRQTASRAIRRFPQRLGEARHGLASDHDQCRRATVSRPRSRSRAVTVALDDAAVRLGARGGATTRPRRAASRSRVQTLIKYRFNLQRLAPHHAQRQVESSPRLTHTE